MANLGNVPSVRVSAIVFRAMGVTPAPGGNYGRAVPVDGRKYGSWYWYSLTAHIAGNSFTIPTTLAVTLLLNGRFVEVERGSIGATFYDVGDGTYFAHEVDGSGTWQVVITNGVPVVTQVNAPSGQRPVVVANGKLSLLSQNDFLLGVGVDFPAILTDGTIQEVSLTAASVLPLVLTNGSTATLQVILHG